MSALPPGGNGTTILMVRCGHAAGLKKRPSVIALKARTRDRHGSVRGRVMYSSPKVFCCSDFIIDPSSARQMLAHFPIQLEETTELFGLDPCALDHLAPFFGLGRDMGAEFRRRVEK